MNFMNDTLINAISWTLIHSLWLGLILALLGGITVLLTKKSSAAVRYNLLAALSIGFLITIGFVFANELKAATPEPVAAASCEASPASVATAISTPVTFQAGTEAQPECKPVSTAAIPASPPADESPLVIVSRLVNNYADWIVWIWFIVLSFKCFRMIDGMRYIYRVRNYQTLDPSGQWQQRMEELKKLLKVSSAVKLMESRLVSVPSVTGFFKPIILVPAGLLTNLPQEQVEAILLHELAHIRRSDYLVNFVQSMMEIIFFFNPAVLWISSLIKDERENCCDDLAISVTNDKREFVHALVSFQEYNLAGQQFAMQFGHKKMHLAERAGRILFNRNKMLSKAEKYFLSLCVVTGAALCISLTNVSTASAAQPKSAYTSLPPDTLVEDTTYRTRHYNPKSILEGTSLKYMDEIDGREYYTYVFKHKGVMYQVSEDRKSIFVNGKYVSGSERSKYEPVIDMLIADYEAKISEVQDDYDADQDALAMEEAERQMEVENRAMERQHLEMERLNKQVEHHSRVIEGYSRQMENKDQREIERLQKKIEKEHEKLQKVADQLHKEALRLDLHARKAAAMAQVEATRSMKEAQKQMASETKRMAAETKRMEAESRRMEAESRIMEAENKRIEAESKRMEAESSRINQQNVVNDIIRDVQKAGYTQEIKSLKLDEKELIINGKKQPAEMHSRLKKYTAPGTTHMYNFRMN